MANALKQLASSGRQRQGASGAWLKARGLLAACTIFLFAYCSSAVARQPEDTFLLGVYQFEPWTLKHHGQVQGIVPQQLEAIFEQLALNYEILDMPYGRLVEKMKKGLLDCTIMARLAVFEGQVDSYGKVYALDKVFLTRSDFSPQSFQDLTNSKKRLIVGYPTGADLVLPDALDSPNIAFAHVKTITQGVQMVSSGRLDVFFSVRSTVEYEVKRHDLNHRVLVNDLDDSDIDIFFQCANASALARKHKQNIVRTLNKLRSDNTFQSIIAQHFSALVP